MIKTFPVKTTPTFKQKKFFLSKRTGKSCPTKTVFIDDYLAPRGQYLHKAIDLFGNFGSIITSTTDGIVKESSCSEKGGYYVRILDNSGNIHYYAHLKNKSLVKTGKKIKIGQIIGYLGNTGNAKSTCPHLHYSIKNRYGKKINPYSFLKQLETNQIYYKFSPNEFLVVSLAGLFLGLSVFLKR